MTVWQIWMISGAVMALLEFLIPGGVIFFIGLASIIVGLGYYLEIIESFQSALLLFFTSSLLLILFVRTFFIKYFEGDSSVDNVDEESEVIGAVVEIIEEVLPHKPGRVRFRDAPWQAMSDESFVEGQKAVVSSREENILIIKSL